jgi:hypothetical protein
MYAVRFATETQKEVNMYNQQRQHCHVCVDEGAAAQSAGLGVAPSRTPAQRQQQLLQTKIRTDVRKAARDR